MSCPFAATADCRSECSAGSTRLEQTHPVTPLYSALRLVDSRKQVVEIAGVTQRNGPPGNQNRGGLNRSASAVR